MLGINVLGS